MKQVMRLAISAATAAQMQSPSLARVVSGFGDFPNAVFDLTEIHFTLDGARMVVRPFRDSETTEPLPLADPIVLDMTWAELRSVEGAPALEAAVRGAAWAVMLSHPKMSRDEVNIFAGGELIEVE